MKELSFCNGYYCDPKNPENRYHLQHKIGAIFSAIKTTEASAEFTMILKKRNGKFVFVFENMTSKLIIPISWIVKQD